MKVQTQAQRAAALLTVAVIIGVGGCAWTPAPRVVDVTIHDDGGKFRFEPAEMVNIGNLDNEIDMAGA